MVRMKTRASEMTKDHMSAEKIIMKKKMSAEKILMKKDMTAEKIIMTKARPS
jgi:hypothetical protein